MKCEITKSNYLTFFVVQTFGIYFVNHFGMCNVFYGIHHTYNVTLLTLCNQGTLRSSSPGPAAFPACGSHPFPPLLWFDCDPQMTEDSIVFLLLAYCT
jgi:hypothetical protein